MNDTAYGHAHRRLCREVRKCGAARALARWNRCGPHPNPAYQFARPRGLAGGEVPQRQGDSAYQGQRSPAPHSKSNRGCDRSDGQRLDRRRNHAPRTDHGSRFPPRQGDWRRRWQRSSSTRSVPALAPPTRSERPEETFAAAVASLESPLWQLNHRAWQKSRSRRLQAAPARQAKISQKSPRHSCYFLRHSNHYLSTY
jgi:hypothetical protein